MTLPFPSRSWTGRLSALLLLFSAGFAHAATFYRAGDLVEEFTLVHRDTREPVRLSDFTGRIVFLEWFAWWCPFCQASAPQVAAGIADWYSERGGNPDGIPVVHVAVNLQPNQESQTQNFVNRAGFSFVLEDFNRALANRFQLGGQPIFAIINAVENSPSHAFGELLLHQDGYGQRDFSQSIVNFRAAIDAVRAAPAIDPPVVTVSPTTISVAEGESFGLAASVEGTAPFEFQWMREGAPVPGATSSEYVVASANLEDGGLYSVQVRNAGGTVTSAAVQVTVAPRMLPMPRIAGIARTAEGRLQVTLEEVAGERPVFESSSNLVDWVSHSVLVPESGRAMVELVVTDAPALFYRVRNE